MICTSAELLESLEKMRDLPVLVVGDLMLDRYVWGEAERISYEAPVPVVHVKKMEDRLGGAGNVVRNLCALGCRVSVCGFVGDDQEGKKVLELLEAVGVEREGVLIDKERPTTTKTRVIARAQQVVRIDREEVGLARPALREGFAAVVEAQLDHAKMILVSDYGKGAVSETLLSRLGKAKQEGRIGLGVRPLVVDPHPINHKNYQGITAAKPNRSEAEKAVGWEIVSQESAFAAGQRLAEAWDAEVIIVSMGAEGMAIVERGKPGGHSLAAVARDVFDVSGAGDTVTAIFGAALAAGASILVAGVLANLGAGVVVSEVGTVPVNLNRLRSEIENWEVENSEIENSEIEIS